MATLSYPARYRCKWGTPETFIGAEAASQTFDRGDFVILDSDGNVATAIASGSDYLSTDPEVLGMALADASGTSLTDIPVMLANDNVEFLLPVKSGNTTAKTQVGVGYELAHVGNGQYAVDVSPDGTASPMVVITEIAKDYPAGETNGWVWVKFLDTEIDFMESTS